MEAICLACGADGPQLKRNPLDGAPLSVMASHSYRLFADYFQFYLQDESANGDLSDAWDPEAMANCVALAPGTVGIGTVRNMDVPVTVEVSATEPSLNLDSWDHVVECDIEVPSGKVVVAGCTDYFPDAARISLEPGQYRARVSFGGLSSLSADGLQGDDHYRVELWKGAPAGLQVLKRDAAPNRRAV